MSQYKTPIKNHYLTGASTHPGGGVFAASEHLRGSSLFEGRKA
jgi:phytoene dehydrogenase-like protein